MVNDPKKQNEQNKQGGQGNRQGEQNKQGGQGDLLKR